MTTSFAHFVRFEFAAAFRAHAVGPFLASFCAFMVPFTGFGVLTGRLWKIETPDRVILTVLVLFCLALVIHWLMKIAI